MKPGARLGRDTAVAVIGAGSMGAGIAQLAAQSGHAVRLFDSQPGATERALGRIDADLALALERGRIDEAERTAVRGRIRAAGTFAELAGCGLAVEAIVENLDAKKALFRELESVLGADAVLATNTSSISITAIAQGLAQPGRVIGWHFFNPVTRMKLVEVIAGVETEPELVAAMHALSKAWGKTSIDAPNAPGFVVNRVARPYYAEGLRLLAARVAAPEAIDRLLREAGGFAMGPFELIDLIGADVNLSVTESVFAATAWDTRYAPHIIQQERVRAGRYGRKTGRGFYDYRDGAKPPAAKTVLPTVPGSARIAVAFAADAGLLAALRERLQRAGVAVSVDPMLTPETLRVGSEVCALTDGCTLAERRRVGAAAPTVLLDLARDFGTTTVLGATGSAEALAALAAVLKPAGVELIALADVAGLVVMRMIAGLVNEAADLMTWTATSAAAIDTAMRLGTAYTQGPLAWADAVGPARVVGVLERLQAHYGEARYRRAPRLSAVHYAKET
ncbi:MAG: 3-hydroxyacyl-CoA dehydrogenase, partial [Caldimonas sp.]